MAFFVVSAILIALEGAIALLFFPVKVRLVVYADLCAPRAAIGMEAAGIRVLDATFETQKEAVRLRINGKKPDPSERKRKMRVEAALRTAIRLAKTPDARLAVVAGSADPFLGAMLWGGRGGARRADPSPFGAQDVLCPVRGRLFARRDGRGGVHPSRRITHIARAFLKGIHSQKGREDV